MYSSVHKIRFAQYKVLPDELVVYIKVLKGILKPNSLSA